MEPLETLVRMSISPGPDPSATTAGPERRLEERDLDNTDSLLLLFPVLGEGTRVPRDFFLECVGAPAVGDLDLFDVRRTFDFPDEESRFVDVVFADGLGERLVRGLWLDPSDRKRGPGLSFPPGTPPQVEPVKPLSFPISGWFVELTKIHDTYAQEYRQCLWEDRHRLPLSEVLRADSLYTSRLFNARKKQRSRATKAWMGVLKKVLEGMMACHCDLDILLDPFFQPVTPTSQVPGRGRWGPSGRTVRGVAGCGRCAPWRIFYRKNLQEHPAFEIPRLPSKFYPSDGD
ncbi:unnamed protein product [Peronospora destructor]|uniref:Uncharacterized protein n=1 Tax=Peronospora destructor TaxID=86335 RepID=A0AAV0TVU7_9STRA|nr:unnamed protein product [Peronospora destructor]